MIKINSDTGNLKLQRYLSNANLAVKTAMERLSTGYRINHAKDDAAGLVISTSLGVQTRSLNIANQNAQMAVNVLGVADGALGQMSDLVMRVRDLATQAANGGYSSSERMALEVEALALTKSLQQLIEGTKFNDTKVLGSANAATTTIGVSTAQELKDALNNNPAGRVVLMNDVDLNTLGFDGSGSNWTAINNFKGIFEGNGYAIKNLKISKSASNQGFFSTITDATIRNVRLENVDIACTGGSYVGGLVGTANGSTIENCSSSGSVKGGSYIGGLVGYNNSGDIINSWSSSSISGGTYSSGGLVGCLASGIIINCYATGDVSGGDRTGGLVGYLDRAVINSYSTGNVTGTNNTGGFVGHLCSSGTITNSWSSGNVTNAASGATASSRFGGFVGDTEASGGTINNCFSTGQNMATIGSRGGFMGYKGSQSVTNVAFVTQTNGYAAVGSGTSLAISGQMASWFQNASNIGFINSGSTNPAYNNQWDLNTIASGGIPILKKITIDKTSTGKQTVYVYSAQELKAALTAPEALNNSNYKVVLMSNIDMNTLGFDGSGSNWTAVGGWDTAFRGTFEGNGYTIKNLTMNRNAELQGLFGCASNATIRNVKLENVNINNTDYYTGALVGYIDNSTIENCSVSGNVKGGYDRTGGLIGYSSYVSILNCSSAANVTGSSRTGGLVGQAYYGAITNCYATGNVAGAERTGGLTGAVSAVISGCYAKGNVTGTYYVGGLTGASGNTITNSYATGNVTGTNNGVGGFVGHASQSTISNCYATGSATGTSYVGGFVGEANSNGTISSSYSSGDVFAAAGASASSYFGGFAGHVYNTMTNCFSTGQNNAAIGIRGGFAGYNENPQSNNNFIVQTGGFGAVGSGNTGGISQQASTYFTNALVQSTLSNGSTAWDFIDGTPKLGWEKSLVKPLTFQIGTDGSELSAITIDTSLNIWLNFSLLTQEDAREAMENCDHLLKQINNKRGELGASLNIMYSITESNAVTNENLSASKSRIMDADIARESANLVKNQILENVAVSLLSQSKNMSGQLLMQLLGGLR